LDATIKPEMMTQKQSEINLIRKIFEEMLKCIGSEQEVYDPNSDDLDLEAIGKE
jgi:hypothetical protein